MLIGKNRGNEGLLSLKQNKSVNLITGLKGIKYHAQLKRLKSMKYILLINVKMPTKFTNVKMPTKFINIKIPTKFGILTVKQLLMLTFMSRLCKWL